jgi:hypothetical protein
VDVAEHGERAIALIDVLLAIVIVLLTGATVAMLIVNLNGRSSREACLSDVRAVQAAQQTRHAAKHRYGASVDSLRVEGYLDQAPRDEITTDNTGKVYVDGIAGSGNC